MVIHALEKANKEDHDRLIELLSANDESIKDEAMILLEKYGAIDYAKNIAQKHVDLAKEALKTFEDSMAKDSLIAVADFVLNRNK